MKDTLSGLFPPKTHSHEKTGLKATLPDHQLDLEETLEAQAGRRGSRAKGTQQDPSPAHDVADDVGMSDEDLIAVLLLLGVCPVDVVPEGGLDPRSIFIIHSLRLPVRNRGVGLDGGAFSQQVCADLADAWQVFTDDVSGFYRTGHGGMDDFIKLQPQACKSQTS